MYKLTNQKPKQMSSFTTTTASTYKLSVSNVHQDFGGYAEQQDSANFVDLGNNNGIFIMADGHGLLGKPASEVTVNTCINTCNAFFTDEKLSLDPLQMLTEVFDECQNRVREAFIQKLQINTRYRIEEKEEDVGGEKNITKIKILDVYNAHTNRLTTAGGTTLTIVLKLGHMLYIANVADSEAGLFTRSDALNPGFIKVLGDSALPDVVACELPFSPDFTCGLEITTHKHTPENPEEFVRCRDVKHNEKNPLLPACEFQYLSNGADQYRDIYEVDAGGVPTIIGTTFFKKNVNGENASVFSVKGLNLAMTRSIGDDFGIRYGFTHKPEVREVNLQNVFTKLKGMGDKYVALVVASDGVWDCWKDDEMRDFLFYDNCIESLEKHGSPDKIASSFIKKHTMKSKQIFGPNTDNSSLIFAYIEEM